MENDFQNSIVDPRYLQSISFGALYNNLTKCCNNIRWKNSVTSYEANALRNTYKLRQEILNGKYQLQKYLCFIVYEPKKREITATRLRDRQLQRSLCEYLLYDDMTRGFIYDNAACQIGKGINFALDRMECFLHRAFIEYEGNNFWYLKCDIHHYFASTPHWVAKQAIAKRIKDPNVLALCYQIVDSFSSTGYGIGLGSQISQLIQLAVLDPLDHYIKEVLGIRYYIRYMDDFILIHNDKEYLRYCKEQIQNYLAGIELQLNHKTTLQPIKNGLVFLQWRYKVTDTGKVLMLMAPDKPKRYRTKLAKLNELVECGTITREHLDKCVECWINNAERGDTEEVVSMMEYYYDSLITSIGGFCGYGICG